jgi:dynein heavy chain
MEDSWTKLDGDTVEKEVTSTNKTMVKAAKIFAGRDLPACAENCVTLKDEIAAFKEFVPLVQALRNPGMRDRHWALLSERLGQKIHPDATFTMLKAQVWVGTKVLAFLQAIPGIARVAMWTFTSAGTCRHSIQHFRRDF